MSNKELVKQFGQSMKAIAKNLEKDPSEVTKAEYASAETEKQFTLTDWQLRKIGGFDAAKKLMFPPDKNIVMEAGSKLINEHRNKLNQKYGKKIFIVEEFKQVLKRVLDRNPITYHKPVKKLKKGKSKKSRTIVAHLSDTHYGCNISKTEVQVNEFNWTIAARRTALFAQQIVNYKPHYREETDLVLCINGDILAGVIHDQEWFVDVLTLQYAGTMSILVQMIGYLAQYFRSVKVVFTPGNHGRAMHKASKERALTNKWDSYETMTFLAIKGITEAKYKNVSAEVPETPFAIFEAQGHHFFQTHGDTVVNVGNPGKSLQIKAINEQVNKLNASEIGGNNKFAAILVGHVHTPTLQLMESGTYLVINGCLSGTDPFALGIGIFSSNPTQQFFEVTEKFPVGDLRFIQVKNADHDESLDEIIKPFKGSI